MWLLRWLIILVLFLQALWMLSALGVPIALLLERDLMGSQLEAVSRAAPSLVGGATPLEASLSVLALFCFLVAIVRLVRRTQGWFYWLMAFVFLALRTLVGVAGGVSALTSPEAPAAILGNLADPDIWIPNAMLLGLNLLIGIAIIAVDVADKRHWATERAQTV
jgi:hypothetical protein